MAASKSAFSLISGGIWLARREADGGTILLGACERTTSELPLELQVQEVQESWLQAMLLGIDPCDFDEIIYY